MISWSAEPPAGSGGAAVPVGSNGSTEPAESAATTAPSAQQPPPKTTLALLIPAAAGCAVSLALGVYGHVHTPTGIAVNVAGFSGPLAAKAWLTTIATVLAVVQLVTALMIYGKLKVFGTPSWIGGLHRWSGRVAFVAAVPVAMQCLYALGFQNYSTRVLIHSLLGCLFFGVFTAKMLVLPRPNAPSWALPLLGGLVFAALVAIWLTSSYWYFTTFGLKT
ncbi:DUF6529 family protein [Catenulispora rubra]|uniref:DUF6529 family protein n=1 Tax=Catenulispora rubra TaxID=280293 RepID=UPI001E374887|nr:DUF6529 family protein [Catenulispora rubra]